MIEFLRGWPHNHCPLHRCATLPSVAHLPPAFGNISLAFYFHDMNFIAGNIYHIYNRGNNKQQIFFKDDNYIYFIEKIRKYISPHCDILAYVLMPNHFHLLIHANEQTEMHVANAPIKRNVLSEGIRLLLSSYTKGINKQENMTGNLIQQTTKSKCVYDASLTIAGYATTCFYYIHDNPVRAGLTSKPQDWDFSSSPDYAELRNGTLCNKTLAKALIDTKLDQAKYTSVVNKDTLKNIW